MGHELTTVTDLTLPPMVRLTAAVWITRKLADHEWTDRCEWYEAGKYGTLQCRCATRIPGAVRGPRRTRDHTDHDTYRDDRGYLRCRDCAREDRRRHRAKARTT